MTAKHTPTPWNAQPTAGHDVHGQSAVYAEVSGKTVAIVYDSSEDAAFIVAACNSHKALLAACKALVERTSMRYPHFEGEPGQAVLLQAREAIKAAEGVE